MSTHSAHTFESSGNISPHSDDQSQLSSIAEHPLTTTLAAAAGGGLAGATVGQAVAGRVGATIGAVIGSVAGVALTNHETEIAPTYETLVNPTKDVAVEAKAIAPDLDPSEMVTEELTPATIQLENGLLAKTHFQIGVNLAQQEQLDAAIDQFQTALSYFPESAETHYNLGVAYNRQGRKAQAIEFMQQAKALCVAQQKLQGAEFIDQILRNMQA